MASIESVTGPLDPDDLGTVLIHEHLRFRDNATADEFPHLYDDDALYAAGVEAANKALRVGVKTIGEPTAMFGGRDVRFMQAVAQ
ncbi:MAG: phosphotriesterase, partial [Thermoleophilaceae bacterium]|nr:phosphotriesterase [Thermoleophilaceae bacterium]